MAEHHRITGALLGATHAAIAAHPHPARKASFAKILAILAAEQAKEHAEAQAAGGVADGSGAGGQVASLLSGGEGGLPMGGAQGAPPSLVDILRGQLGGQVRY